MIRMYIEKRYGDPEIGRASHIKVDFEDWSEVKIYTGMLSDDCHISFEEVIDKDNHK